VREWGAFEAAAELDFFADGALANVESPLRELAFNYEVLEVLADGATPGACALLEQPRLSRMAHLPEFGRLMSRPCVTEGLALSSYFIKEEFHFCLVVFEKGL
ncbi:unnamed protein product, partial [Prorocentrum cordatum]